MVGTDIGALLTSPDWGTVPDWLAALGTISAVVLALRLAHRDGKRLEDERRGAAIERAQAYTDRRLFREQQEAEAEERKRRLASKVSLVVEPYRDTQGARHVAWNVHNGSEEPITMVSVVRRALPVEEGAEKPLPMICKTWTSIEAGGERFEATKVYDEHNMREGELQFTDGAGQRWQRMEFGTLRMIEADDPDAIGMVALQR